MAKFILYAIQHLAFEVYRKFYDFECGFKYILTCLIFWFYGLFLVDDTEEFFEVLNFTDEDEQLDINLAISVQSINIFFTTQILYIK